MCLRQSSPGLPSFGERLRIQFDSRQARELISLLANQAWDWRLSRRRGVPTARGGDEVRELALCILRRATTEDRNAAAELSNFQSSQCVGHGLRIPVAEGSRLHDDAVVQWPHFRKTLNHEGP